jgi:hypothetical protein
MRRGECLRYTSHTTHADLVESQLGLYAHVMASEFGGDGLTAEQSADEEEYVHVCPIRIRPVRAGPVQAKNAIGEGTYALFAGG